MNEMATSGAVGATFAWRRSTLPFSPCPVLILALASCLATSLLGLSPDKRITQFSVHTWSQEQGLPSSAVLSMLQGNDGYLWLGTNAGLVRFDGVRFVTPEPLSGLTAGAATILSLASGSDGSLWLGTGGGGLLRYHQGTVTTFGSAQGLPDQNVNALLFDAKGQLWIGTGAGLVVWKDGRIQPAAPGLSQDPVWSLADDGAGGLWVATYRSGLIHLTSGVPRVYGREQGLPGKDVRTVYRSRNGTLWVGVTGAGLFRSEGDRFIRVPAPAGLALVDIWSILEDRDGSLWIGAGAGGVARWNGHRMEVLTDKTGLTAGYVLTLVEDREGNLWAGARSGLNRLREDKLTPVTTGEGLPSNMIGPVMELSPGQLLLGTMDAGAAIWNGPDVPTQPVLDSPGKKVFALHRDRDSTLWLGTDHGLSRWHNGARSSYTTHHGLPSDIVFSMAPAPSGFWVGTLNGLCLWNGQRCRPPSLDRPLPQQGVFALERARDGAIWAGFSGGGICRLQMPSVRCWGESEGLPAADVFDLHEDSSGAMWVATLAGLVRIFNQRVDILTGQHGLPANAVFGIVEDGRGLWWLSTSEGIFGIKPQNLDAVASGQQRSLQGIRLDRFDGLRSSLTAGVQPAAWRASNGVLWFSTNRGLVSLDPARLRSNPVATPVHVEEIQVDGTVLSTQAPLEIAPGARNIAIHYSGLSLTAPERVQFRYRLEGYDDDWIDVGTRRVAYYSNLAPGLYRFRVMASNNDGLWSQPSAALDLRQQPHPWQTWWFLALCLATVGGLAYAWSRYRLAQAEARFHAVLAERSRIARDLHDTLLGDFTGVTMQLGAMLLSSPEKLNSRTLEPLVTRMEESLRDAREAVQMLRARDEPNRSLSALLAEVGQRVARDAGVEFQLIVHGEECPLPPSTWDCAYRVVLEAVRNAVRHSGSETVVVEADFRHHDLRICVRDSGCGFVPTDPPPAGHYGVKGMHEHAQAAKGQLQIESSQRGTIVELILPKSAPKAAWA